MLKNIGQRRLHGRNFSVHGSFTTFSQLDSIIDRLCIVRVWNADNDPVVSGVVRAEIFLLRISRTVYSRVGALKRRYSS